MVKWSSPCLESSSFANATFFGWSCRLTGQVYYVSDKSVVWRILISAICNLPHSSLISFQVQICVETSVYKFWEKNIVRCATPSAGERLSESMQYPCTTSHWSSGRSYEAKWISETQWDYDLVMANVLAMTRYWHGFQRFNFAVDRNDKAVWTTWQAKEIQNWTNLPQLTQISKACQRCVTNMLWDWM